jgi:cytidylate kinase
MSLLHSVDRMEQKLFKKKYNIDYPDLYVVALVLKYVGMNLGAAEIKVIRKYLREIRGKQITV